MFGNKILHCVGVLELQQVSCASSRLLFVDFFVFCHHADSASYGAPPRLASHCGSSCMASEQRGGDEHQGWGAPPIPLRFLTCAFSTVASWGMFVWGGRGVVSPLDHPQLVYYYISILRMISQPPKCDHEFMEIIGWETNSAA